MKLSSITKWILAHPLIAVIILVILIAFMFGAGSWWTARRYDKKRIQYEADSKTWAVEKATLLGQVSERDKQIEQLKAKEAAYIAADQAGKKVDDALAKKIDDVTKAAADEALATDQPASCWLRAERTCAKLGSLRPPIVIDCNAYKRKLCG